MKIKATTIFILLVILIAGFFFFANQVLAEEEKTDIRELKLNVPIGELSEMQPPIEIPKTINGEQVKVYIIPWAAQYISAVFKAMALTGSLFAVIVLMIGGVAYIIAGANQSMLAKSKEYIFYSIFGLVIILTSYLVLNLANPELTKLKALQVEKVKMGIILPEFCEDIEKIEDYKGKIEISKTPIKDIKYTGGAPLKYKDNQNVTCGKVYEMKSISPDVSLPRDTCMGKDCAKTTDACVLSSKNVTPNVYNCKSAYVHGTILGTDLTYLDNLYLYNFNKSVAFLGKDLSIGVSNFNSGDTQYAIGRGGSSLTFSDIFYIEIEINDPAVGPTNDDDYIIDKNGNPIGIEGSMCCTYECTGTKKFKVTPGCDYIKTADIANKVLEVDINARDFFCGGIPLQESYLEGGGKDDDYEWNECFGALSGVTGKPVGEFCNSDDNCASGDCESEKGTGQCECNINSDCPEGTVCITSWLTYNKCENLLPLNAACKVPFIGYENSLCSSGICMEDICVCAKDSDCPEAKPNWKVENPDKGIRCITKDQDSSLQYNQCQICKQDGQPCSKPTDCCNNYCSQQGICKQ